MIDIGANLSNSQFSDINTVLENSFKNGVSTIILTSTNIDSYYKNKTIINNNKTNVNLFNTIGLHPHKASHYINFFNQLDDILNDPKIICLGEFGLDYYRMLSEKHVQLKVMEMFLEKSKNLNLPLFLHERQAHLDFLYLLKNNYSNINKVVHCFTGNCDQLKNYLDNDCYIGITGWLNNERRAQDLIKSAKYIPLDRLMIESDSPYLSPLKSIKLNEPQYLGLVLKRLSEIIQINENDLLKITLNNTKKFFNLTKKIENKN